MPNTPPAVINPRLVVLASYYAEIDALIATEAAILDTYEGMLSLCNDGEGSDDILPHLARHESELSQLREDRAEIDRMWNEALAAAAAA